MDMNLCARLMPVIMRAVLGNSFNLRMLMAAEFVAMTMDEQAEVIQSGFQAGRAYATEAARMRD
eukprot:3835213-Pyramimonas_sp.AAC.1